MAAYFILIAAQIVDLLSISILIVAVVIALGFFILPQVRLSKVVKKVKEKMESGSTIWAAIRIK